MLRCTLQFPSQGVLQCPFKSGITAQGSRSDDFQCHFKPNKTTTQAGNPNDPPYRERQREKIVHLHEYFSSSETRAFISLELGTATCLV